MRTIIAIGRNVLLSHKGAQTEVTAPHLLLIGKNVNLTGHVAISTHDYSWSVVRGVTGEILVKQKPIFIGDNAFIGWGASIFGRYRNRGALLLKCMLSRAAMLRMIWLEGCTCASHLFARSVLRKARGCKGWGQGSLYKPSASVGTAIRVLRIQSIFSYLPTLIISILFSSFKCGS